MTPEQWQSLIDIIGSRSLELILAAVGGLIAAWVAFRFGIRRDRERVEAELRKEISRLRAEKADTAVESCWDSAQSAWKVVSIATAAYKQFPDLSRISDDALEEFLAESRLSENHKQQIAAATNRNKQYQEIIF